MLSLGIGKIYMKNGVAVDDEWSQYLASQYIEIVIFDKIVQP